jgi:uncharacterized protein
MSLAPQERFARLEDPGTDFPFYRGEPVAISAGQWLFVMAMIVMAFLALTWPMAWPAGRFWTLLQAALLPGLPLLALAWVAQGHWRVVFGRVRGRELRLMLGFAMLNLLVSLAVGGLVATLFGATPNGATSQLANLDTAGRIAFYAKTLPQLLGEEVITLLPFLALLQGLSKGLGVGRKGGIVGAWLATSVLFGLIHLPTYGWNWVQCILVIGSARMMLTLPWILTKNLWVSTGAHVINDWLLFTMTLVGASVVNKG